MNASKQAEQTKCAGCGAAISGNMDMAVKLPGREGKTFPVCSDKCGKKVWDSQSSQLQSQGRRGFAEDALMKSFGLPTAREQQIAKETDRFLRDLGL